MTIEETYQKINQQVEQVKVHLQENIFDLNGNVKEGITSEQIRSATKIILHLTSIIDNFNKENRNIVNCWNSWNKQKKQIVDDLKNSDQLDIYAKQPMLKALLGL